jgi:hypothetical protein
MAKNDTDLKVKPGKNLMDSKGDLKSKAKALLLKHPEVLYNARGLFHNENGKTIIEEMVPRGDLEKKDVIMPRNQSDLTDKDLRELAVHAASLVDQTLMQYDKKVAYEDALQRAVATKDSGKYAGKINASTFSLILDQMGKKKQAAFYNPYDYFDTHRKIIEERKTEPYEKSEIDIPRAGSAVKVVSPVSPALVNKINELSAKMGLQETVWVEQNAKMYNPNVSAGPYLVYKGPKDISKFYDEAVKLGLLPKVFGSQQGKQGSKEARMDKDLVLKEIEATKVKLAALEVLADDGATDKDAGKAEMIKCPTCGGKVLKATGYCLACKKKIGGGDKKDEKKDGKKGEDKKDEKKEDKKEEKKEEKKEATTEKTAMQQIVESIEDIAGVCEAQKTPELVKIAYQLDMVCDVLEGKKEAATLQSDADEKYMREYFHAGTREADADEKKYMNEFNTDMSTELNNKYPNGLGKDASDLPYKVVK